MPVETTTIEHLSDVPLDDPIARAAFYDEVKAWGDELAGVDGWRLYRAGELGRCKVIATFDSDTAAAWFKLAYG